MAATSNQPDYSDFKAFTFEARLGSQLPVHGPAWQAYLIDFLEDLSAQVTALPGCVPGHLKLSAALAEDGGHTLKLSSLGFGIPVTADGGFEQSGRQMTLVLNLLTAGVAAQALEPVCMRALGRLCGRYGLVLI